MKALSIMFPATGLHQLKRSDALRVEYFMLERRAKDCPGIPHTQPT
jgi:hypothetical protein